jgi:hypothetical protein
MTDRKLNLHILDLPQIQTVLLPTQLNKTDGFKAFLHKVADTFFFSFFFYYSYVVADT